MNRELEGAAAAAVELFRHSDESDVAAVYIVGGRRPSADDIRCLDAELHGLTLTVDRFGDLCLRRNGELTAAPVSRPDRTGPSSVHRAVRHLAGWNAGFPGLSEGVR